MAKIPAFSEIGKGTKELLYGGKSGTFQYNHAVTISTKTADGVEFTVVATKAEDRVVSVLKTGYKTKAYGLTGAFTSAGTVTTSGTYYGLFPGLDVTLTGTIPDVASAKLGFDYSIPHLTVKGLVGLTNQPKVDLAVTTGHNDIVLGAAATLDTAKGDITKWDAGVGYVQRDFSVGMLLKNQGKALSVGYLHNIDAASQAGAEITKKLEGEEATTFVLGYAKRLESGALVKARLENTGLAALLYENEVKPQTKLALSTLFDATDLSKPPKVGMALDVKN